MRIFIGQKFSPPCGIPALVDAGTHDDPLTATDTSVHVAGGYRAPPYTHHRHREARRARTVRLRSLVSPSVRSVCDVPPRLALPPSGTRSLRRTDRPRAQQVIGNGCPLALVDRKGGAAFAFLSFLSTSPETPTYSVQIVVLSVRSYQR